MLRDLLSRFVEPQICRVNIEQFTHYSNVIFITGWAFFEHQPYQRIYFLDRKGRWQKVAFKRLSSADVSRAHPGKATENARFSLTIATEEAPENIFSLRLKFTSGLQSFVKTKLHVNGVNRGPYRNFVPKFFKQYVEEASPKAILEVGSRARSGVNNRETYIPKDQGIAFTGIDVLPGEGVDVVCDAHELSRHLPADHFDLVYSMNVFEHLLMPWKVVLELNRVMKTDGIVMVFTHQSFPLHDLPWDYFRFSDNAWHALFNQATGFEIIETQLLDRVSVVPRCVYEGSLTVEDGDAFIHSAVIAKKIGSTNLEWDVSTSSVLQSHYPE